MHFAQFPLCTQCQSHYYFCAMEEQRSKLQWQTLQHLLDILQGLTILDLCSEGTWTATSTHNTAKGVACETRSEPPPSPAFLAVRLTPRAKRTCLLALMNVRNATSPCLRLCCTNSRIIISFLHVRMNQSTKISIFARKGGCANYQGVRIIRNYTVLNK